VIRIETIEIEKFRGVRELTLDLRQENFGICGPNGTGKSGVVDAIEFALTGDVSRLSGRGTGDLSLKAHAPHVKEHKTPKQAVVRLRAHVPALGKSATITRSVVSPSNYTLEPDEPDIRAVIEETQIHPEFALSRREIIRYILAEPNKRSADVQELLRLSDVEQTRKALTSLANEARRERDAKQQAQVRARSELLKAFEIDKPDPAAILTAVNERRAVLALAPLEKLEAGTSLKEGVREEAAPAQAPVKKAQAKSDLDKVRRAAADGEDEETAEKRAAALQDIKSILEDAAALRSIRQQALVKAGMELVDEDSCPLCDTPWDHKALLKHLADKLDSAKEAGELISRLNANLNHIIGELDAHAGLITRIIADAAKLETAPETQALSTYKTGIEDAAGALRAFVADASGIDKAKDALEFQWWALTGETPACLDACSAAVKALPDVSDEDKARDFLTRAEDHYRRAVEARAESQDAEAKADTAAKVLEVYEAKTDDILVGLYDEVAGDFTAYYRSLNHEDEGEFEGRLIPSAAKLGFDVDFYGYGKFPPGAYHSEGHQDGMGLCLYLALMKRTLGDKFTFSVLDDVLMSVDTEHRREVCKLLKREFPDTQFILTTHDPVWLKYMHTEGLVKDSVSFSGWSVETGPKVWQHQEVWEEIEEALNKNDVQGAAAKLRHYLEFIANTMADSLRAEVRFKGDGRYDLGDLMPPVVNRWRKKLRDAVKAAKSWAKDEDAKAVGKILEHVDEARARVRTEEWAINPAVHYNAWANLQADEFRQVVSAFADLLATMQCDNCKSFVELQPRGGSAEIIRCNCSDIAINLKQKGA